MLRLLTASDNVQDKKLDAGINVSQTTIVLEPGNGDAFPGTINGSATSEGSATELNNTGIGVSSVAVGDHITNITDGSSAVIEEVDTDSIVTTKLAGGNDNMWQDSDIWAVNSFVATLNKKDIDNQVTSYEKILVDHRSGDTLYVNSSGRGYDGSTAQSWTVTAEDPTYCELFITSSIIKKILNSLSWINRLKADIVDCVLLTGAQTIAGIKTLTSFPILPSASPTTNYQAAHKKYVDDEIASIGIPYPKTIYQSSPTTFSAGSIQTITHGLGVTEANVELGKYKVLITGTAGGKGCIWDSSRPVESGGGGIGSPVYSQEWNSGTPGSTGQWYWQESTLKFACESVHGDITNAIIQIIQNYA